MTIIDGKYFELGGEDGWLGPPTTTESLTPNGLGSYRHYQNGSIYWKHVLPVAFEVHGLIRQKWAELGWENSFLGFPLSDETPTPDPRKYGRFNNFDGGVVAWSPATGAHETHGLILQRWLQLGREGGFGFPLTDELTAPDTIGRYNHFEIGSIYWSPTTGAHEVTDNIKAMWANSGWEQGPLGYPVAAPGRLTPTSSPTDFQDFQHGSIYDWLGNSRLVLRNPSVVGGLGNIIDWSSFDSILADSDRISASFMGHDPNADTKITLHAGPGINWWKAVSVWSPSLGDLAEAWTQDGHTSTTITIPPATLEPGNVFLVFKKAKMFGVHTPMYWLARADRLIGNNVDFTWLND